jgi:hypothetical protein
LSNGWSRFFAACSIAADASTANHARDKRRERLAGAAGAASEIADRPGALGERGQRGEVKTIAEELVAQPIPLAGRRGEELLRFAAPRGKVV